MAEHVHTTPAESPPRRDKRPRTAPRRRASEEPALPPLTEEERRFDKEITLRLLAAARMLQQRNLDNAVQLAMEAARGQGDLVDHFAELGRRFGSSTVKEKAAKLTVIDGGAA